MTEVPLPEAGRRSAAYEVSLLTILAALVRRWKLIVLLPLCLAGVAVASRLLSEREYAAVSQFMPESPDQRARISGIAAQLGLSAGVSNSAESLEFYQFLLSSPDLLLEAVTSTYRIGAPGAAGSVEATLVDYYQASGDTEFERRQAAAKQLENNITVTLDRAAGLVTLETRALEPELAVQVNRKLIDLVGSFNLERRQTRARAERQFVEAQVQQAQKSLEAAEHDLERFLEENRRYTDSPSLRFEAGRLERRIAIRQEVYGALVQAMEQARIDEVRNTPVISLVSRPETSVGPVARRTVLTGVLVLIGGFMIAVVLALLLEYVAQYRHENPGAFARLARRGDAGRRAGGSGAPAMTSIGVGGELASGQREASGAG